MKWLFFFLVPFTFCFAFPYEDPTSGLKLEMPDSFQLSETDQNGDQWWYKFTDAKGSEIIIEIEEFDKRKPLSEHSKRSRAGNYGEDERMRLEELDFDIFEIGELEICKCSLRMIAFTDICRQPLYLCDYLFVRDHFGFTISLLQYDDDESDSDIMMQTLLHSIQFSTNHL